jgi:cell division protein FtsB
MADIKITTEDIQAVMVEDPRVSLQVQVKALTRTLQETEGEVTRLTEELEALKNGKSAKEK